MYELHRLHRLQQPVHHQLRHQRHQRKVHDSRVGQAWMDTAKLADSGSRGPLLSSRRPRHLESSHCRRGRRAEASISAAHLLVASRQGRSGSLPSQGVPCPHHPTTHDDVTSVPLASYRAPPVAAAGCIVDFRRVSPMAGEPPRQCGTSRAGLGGCSTVDTSRCDACAHRGGCPIIQTDCFYGMPHAAALPALMPLSPARDSC